MPFPLSKDAIDDAKFYLTLFDAGTRRRGEDYFSRERVAVIKPEGESTWLAVVTGQNKYEVVLEHSDGMWTGDCTCPVEGDCKHVYAAMKALIAEAEKQPVTTKKREKKNPLETGQFRDIAATRLGRRLTSEERRIANDVHSLYLQYRNQTSIPEYRLDRLAQGYVPYSWKERELWPSPPENVWVAWLYMAYALRLMERRSVPFLAAITAENEIHERLGSWVRERETQRWRELLDKLEHEQPEAAETLMDLRVVFEPDAARLEFSERGMPWAVMKKTRHEQVQRNPNRKFASDDAMLVWSAFHKSWTIDGALKYDSEDSFPSLNELLRNPLLADRILSVDRVPLLRPEEPLVWKVRAPAGDDPDYEMTLVLPDGTMPADPLVCLPGRPPLYVTADTVYKTSPVWRLNPKPSAANRIPASVLESSAGVQLLKRIDAPLPERLTGKIEVVQPRLIVEASIEARWQVEHLEVRFLADWGDAAPMEAFGDGKWEPVDGALAASRNREHERILHLDRSSLGIVPHLAEQLGVTGSDDDELWTRKLGRNFPEQFSAWLLTLPPDLELRLTPDLASLREAPVSAEFRLEVEPSGVDWFDVQTVLSVKDVEFSQAELKALLNAKGGWVRLGHKGWRKLALKWSDEDEEKLAELGLSSADFSGEPQRMHALQLSSERSKSLLPPERYEAVRRRAEEIKTRVSPPIPAGITAELRPYQVEGFHFLAYLAANRFGGVLADDMGLGKTLQTLTWLAWLRAEHPKKKPGPSLVVCPKSVTSNWETEAGKFLPGLSVHIWTKGTEKALKETISETDLLVLNYAQLRVMSEVLTKQAWFAVILDEAQAIKNPDSQTARAACQLNAAHRLALSGTPVENRLLDLWSIFAFSMPGILGPRSRFAKTYDKADDLFARRRLAARVRPFLLRRTKSQVAKDLPPRTEEDLLCVLEGKQDTLYKAELKRARQMLLKIGSAQELDKQRFNILTSLLRLRQICCHPALVDANSAESGSAKMEALVELLEPLMQEGHKVLVFSQFVGVLELIREELVRRDWQYSVLTGETENRGELVSEFQASKGARVFLLSLKAGGAGLNLTAASYVVLFDPWWNPAVENQAIDRTHRIGQTEHVNAYRLLIRNSIEEKIRNLQKSKSALAEDILGEEAFARTLTLQDFQFLLGVDDSAD